MPIHFTLVLLRSSTSHEQRIITFNSVDGIFSFQWLSIRNHLGFKLQCSEIIAIKKAITKIGSLTREHKANHSLVFSDIK